MNSSLESFTSPSCFGAAPVRKKWNSYRPEKIMPSETEKLLGAWRLISWEEHEPGREVTYPVGPDAVGQISYDAAGRMSAQLVRPNQQRFTSEDWREASKDEKASAWSNYFGYFGTYTVNEKAATIVHHIEGSWFPNLVGTDQVRHYRFDGDRVILNADTKWGHVRIIWEKINGKQ
jgi:hypothetical protein